nr:MAG TPA: hypothetical protein [Caudoviricetes sp.]
MFLNIYKIPFYRFFYIFLYVFGFFKILYNGARGRDRIIV